MSSKSSASDWVSDGNRLFAEGKHKDALKSYESALKTDKKHKEALIGKGLVQQKLGNANPLRVTDLDNTCLDDCIHRLSP